MLCYHEQLDVALFGSCTPVNKLKITPKMWLYLLGYLIFYIVMELSRHVINIVKGNVENKKNHYDIKFSKETFGICIGLKVNCSLE